MSLPAPPELGQFRILVVEDDPSIARLILTTLTRAGFECRYAPDGREGWTAFQSCDPHLVLTDIMMPGMNGQELVLKIRETSTVPIIMMTAVDTEDTQLAGFKSGADDYVSKPFNPRLMTARVIAHLRRVYRYDFNENKARAQTAQPSVPIGWGQCRKCDYMGPREQFKTEIIDGESKAVCPACGEAEHLAYSVG